MRRLGIKAASQVAVELPAERILVFPEDGRGP